MKILVELINDQEESESMFKNNLCFLFSNVQKISS